MPVHGAAERRGDEPRVLFASVSIAWFGVLAPFVRRRPVPDTGARLAVCPYRALRQLVRWRGSTRRPRTPLRRPRKQALPRIRSLSHRLTWYRALRNTFFLSRRRWWGGHSVSASR